MIQRKYSTFLEHLQSLDVLGACDYKPLIDGKALAKALDTRPGPWMTDALDVVMAWQLRNPGQTDPEEAIAEVRRKRGELPFALARHFLKLTIRPLFAKTRPVNVTEAGRSVVNEVPPPKVGNDMMDEEAVRPWKKGENAFALSLLRWSVGALTDTTVEVVWPLLLPPILTLIDDWEVRYKVQGVALLRQVLEVTPAPLLRRTGLGGVFEKALSPCLTYIPDLTPEDESIEMLGVVYPTFIVLYQKDVEDERQRVRSFDTLIRKGVLFTHGHCPNNTRVLSIVCTYLATILDDIGIESVKHLQYIVPMLTNMLCRPGPDQGHLKATMQALQAVIRNGWPRMSEYRTEVLKGLSIGWLKTEEGDQWDDVRHEMRETLAMFKAALGTQQSQREQEEFDMECAKIVQANAVLAELVG